MRGRIYRLRAAKDAQGHEQAGTRYAVVVQTTRLEHLSTWVVAPTSSSPNAHRGLVRPAIDWGDGASVVLCDAVASVDPERRLGKEVGFVSFAQMQEIDRALKFLLDLP